MPAAGGEQAVGAPAAPTINPFQQAALDQLQGFLGNREEQLNKFMTSTQAADQQRRSQAQAIEQQLEQHLNQRLATQGQPDAITESRLADFEAQSSDEEAQLREELQRLGLLTTGGDTIDELAKFAGAQERTRQSILGEGQARQEAACDR